MERRMKEVIRYLGYGNHAVEAQTLEMIESSLLELEEKTSAKSFYRIFEIEREADEKVTIGIMHIESRNLSKNLKGCEKAVLFGATLGAGADRLMQYYSLTDMGKTVILQACAAAMLEEYCDECQDAIADAAARDGYFIRPRFSPGYGDFDIRHQKALINMLELPKRIGLTLTDACMMVPTKSVTAVIGLSKEETPCHRHGCEVCTKIDCQYRRN